MTSKSNSFFGALKEVLKLFAKQMSCHLTISLPERQKACLNRSTNFSTHFKDFP